MPLFDFNNIALEYDSFYDTSMGKKIDHLEKMAVWTYLLKMDLEKKMLEIGCGTGHWTKFFKKKGIEMIAIDVADKMLEAAKSKNQGSVDFRLMSVEDLDFGDHSFSNIISIATLEFVDHLDRTLSEIDRVLKPGGYFLAGCLNARSEIGMKKHEHAIYRDARFFEHERLYELLCDIGSVEMDACVITEGDRVLDYPDYTYVPKQERLQHGAFLIAFVHKN
jgi:ubiquinone/menaquinone biosynthesis C-methylase UbiE